MTDRYAGFVVTLSADVREDDAEAVVTALRMIRGVAQVRPVVSGGELHIAEARADQRWRDRLLTLIRTPEAVDRINQQGSTTP